MLNPRGPVTAPKPSATFNKHADRLCLPLPPHFNRRANATPPISLEIEAAPGRKNQVPPGARTKRKRPKDASLPPAQLSGKQLAARVPCTRRRAVTLFRRAIVRYRALARLHTYMCITPAIAICLYAPVCRCARGRGKRRERLWPLPSDQHCALAVMELFALTRGV